MNSKMRETYLWTAIVTPFEQDLSIDWQSFETILRKQAEAKNGIVLLGSTGEALALSLEERKEVVSFATNLELETPLLVGVGGFDLPSVQAWLQYCETMPIDGYLMVAPLYAKPGRHGQTAWFRALLDTVTRPCMLYNVPSRTGIAMDPAVLSDLRGHKNLWALKEASGSLERFQEFQASNPDVAMYSGEDSLMPFLASLGATGLVSVAGNTWPKATNKYVRLSKSGEHSSLFPVWSEASGELFKAANPIPAKVLLQDLGWITSATVRPPLATEDFCTMETLRAANLAVESWNSANQGVSQ